MKYNDISVTKSSWEELVRDSFGGYRNASAYCLMYINDKAQLLIQGKSVKLTSSSFVWLVFVSLVKDNQFRLMHMIKNCFSINLCEESGVEN